VTRGVVVASQPDAAVAGRTIYERGGNAADAAVATALAQGVVDPLMAGLGGFGAAVVAEPRTAGATVIDFPARAGSRATPDMFAPLVEGRIRGHAERYRIRDHANQVGYRSVCTPGVPAGLWEIHRRFGALPWPDLFGPAIRLAAGGFVVSGDLHGQWTRPQPAGHADAATRFAASLPAARTFLTGGAVHPAGTRIVQPDLAASLARLAGDGPETFYRGSMAKTIIADFTEHGGLMVAEDLASYRAVVTPAVAGRYRGHAIYTCPPPSSGCQLVEILNILDGLDLDALAADLAEYVRVVALAQRASFVDRATLLADPAFAEVPVDTFLSAERAKHWRDRILAGEPIVVPGLEYHDSPGTTNVSTVDANGLAVALTHTLGSGSGVVVDGLGFGFNNCMYQFHPLPGHPNSIAPGKARISGIAPTVAVRDGRARLVLGGAGGTRIITAIAHTLVNVLDLGMSPVEAVAAPRFHSESELIEMEWRLYAQVADALRDRGERPHGTLWAYDPAFARLDVAHVDWEKDRASGSADPRAGGTVMSTWTGRTS
jgi:gamma-glutamyltranspeptidase/glutathione hydrolase